MNEENTNTDNGRLRKLPLWRALAEEMITNGVEHGKTYPAEYFEKGLSCLRTSLEYGFSISEIRKVLEDDGYYLSGMGQNGTAFVIVEPERHVDIAESRERQATILLFRAVKLLTATRHELLEPEDKQKLDSLLARVSIKAALVSRDNRTIRKPTPALPAKEE